MKSKIFVARCNCSVILAAYLIMNGSFIRSRNFGAGNSCSRIEIKRLARLSGEGENKYVVEDSLVHFPSGTVVRDRGVLAPSRGLGGQRLVDLLVRDILKEGRLGAAPVGNSHVLEASLKQQLTKPLYS
jgi:hypothetical protein